ncbi:thiol-disulfide oxidoreductase DCC family protein [Microbacterium sp. 179-I 3D4 NHS]|uniref:thiol-disulfide oxidoreductase DCC family protein n=1 Tax=Microbacterium sp. 179-I 3D4 NHS TaxID=3142381 RepID=UPI00399EE9B9
MGTVGTATPAARPLLVFDGDCGFCTTWVGRLERTLSRFPEAQPSQWTDVEALGLTRGDVTRYVWLLAGGKRYRGHAAFAAMLRMQPQGVVRFAGQLLVTPPFSWAAAVGYALIARFRHRLPGGTAACALPRPV